MIQWGIDGGSILRKEVADNIRDYPIEFVKKIAYNMIKTVFSGFYVTEIANVTNDETLRNSSKSELIRRYMSGNYEHSVDELIRVVLLGGGIYFSIYALLSSCCI